MFALGETLLQPTIPALVNDLAPDHLRGRYNALSSGAFQLAAVIAPAVSGLLIGRALGEVYIGLLVVGSLVCGVIAIGRLEGQLDPRVNGVDVPLDAPPPATPEPQVHAATESLTGPAAGMVHQGMLLRRHFPVRAHRGNRRSTDIP